MTRGYRMRVRAVRHEDTRRRILEAAVHLHKTADPDRITITEIARLAGVERPTVLRHFRDRITLLMACTFGDPVPAAHATAWAADPDPEARLSTALSEQYAWYRRNRRMLQHLLFAVESDPELAATREVIAGQRTVALQVLSEGWLVGDARRPHLLIGIRHAFDFWPWLSFAEAGATDEEAVAFMVDVVRRLTTS